MNPFKRRKPDTPENKSASFLQLLLGRPDMRLQYDYWRYNPVEQNGLMSLYSESQDRLSWSNLLRLQQLTCMEILESEWGRSMTQGKLHAQTRRPDAAISLCEHLAQRLTSEESPYRPSPVAVWQEEDKTTDREPDIVGFLTNASLTHLGCLEVIRPDEHDNPTALGFVPFSDIHLLILQGRGPVRGGKIVYKDRREEIVGVPLLYGLSLHSQNPNDHNGSLTRMFSTLIVHDAPLGIGLGHQDLTIISPHGPTVFGVGSVSMFVQAALAD